MKTLFFCLLITLFTPLILLTAAPADPPGNSTQVVPVRWAKFSKSYKKEKDIEQSRQILANAIRFNLNWIPNSFALDQEQELYTIERYNEHGIRPAASVCYAAAVALKCAQLKEQELGVSRQVALERITRLIKGLAAAYRTNRSDGKGWGKHWQSAFWATLVGQGAWMLWEDLDAQTQQMVQTLVVEEANRFTAPGYKVPYWTDAHGKINTPGDTKAEENAWNATILQLAVAMMPHHPQVAAWKQICSELMISSFALKSDLQNNQQVDGKPVKDWLQGFNVRDDGAVINHHIVHPDYTMSVTIKTRSFLTQSLAGQPVSQGAQLDAPFIYRSLTEHVWTSPPNKAPGGTMYIPGKAEVYYPQGTDWSKFRFDIYYLMDVNAHVLGWDKGLKHKAADWMRIRGNRIQAMQARHSNGSMFTQQEYPTYPGKEQMVAWQTADAYMLFWLDAKHAMARPRKAGKGWLSSF
jgi:hypothetical protein